MKTMPYLFQYLFEEIKSDLKNLKTDVDKDRVIIDNLIRMTNSLKIMLTFSNL